MKLVSPSFVAICVPLGTRTDVLLQIPVPRSGVFPETGAKLEGKEDHVVIVHPAPIRLEIDMASLK